MADFGVTGEVVVTSEKAEAAFDRVGDKATQMANEVASAAGKAGQAVDGVGAGAEKSADKFTRAESRMRDAIKRSTQELQLLGKTASEKLEFNIQAKGLDAAKFAPYIEELKKAEAAQKIATGSLDKMGVSAAQTAAALRGVPAQFTDIITSLQAGQAPLTVFLQQGGQLKDMFGGAGAAARALGGYVAGLINPFTLAAVAVGGLGLAYAAGSKEADGYRQALVLTGNQAGSTVGQMQQMAQQIAGVTGSQREAAAALAEFASSGKVGQENLRQFTQTAIEFSRVTGQSVDAVAKNFADLAKDPLKATLKLNESMNYLTESIFRQIQSLQDQGRETEAANVAQKAYADTLNERKDEIVRNLGTIEKAWAAIKKEANSAMDAFLDIGRLSTLETRLQRAQSALQSYQSTLPGQRTTAQVAAVEQFGGEEGLKREIAGLKDLIENQRKSAEMERERATAVKASTDLATDAQKYESDLEKQRRAVLSATEKYQTALAKGNLTAEQRNQLEADYLKLVSGITAVKEKKGGRGGLAAENKDLRDQQRIFAELADVSSTYYADLEKAQQQRAKGNLSEAQYVKYVEELIQKQPFAVAQEKARAEAIKESAKAASESSKALSAWAEVRAKESQGLQTQINARREEVSLMDMTAEAVVAYTQAKYEQQAAEKEAYAAALESASFYAGEYAEAYNIAAEAARNQAKQLRELGGLEVEKVNREAAKKAKDEWQKTSDKINDTLTDALMRGFESGKDFAKNMRDTVVNMFKTMVLRPIISAVVNPVAGALTGAFGMTGAANAATGGAGGANILSTVQTGFAALNGSISTSIGNAFGKFAGSSVGQSLGLSNAQAIAGNNPSAYVPAGGQLTGTGQALGSALGVVGNTLAGYALGSMAQSLISGGYSVSKGMDTFQKVGVAVGSALGGPLVGSIIGAGAGVFNRLFGRKLKDSGIQGTFGGTAGFDGEKYEFYKGGWFRSNKTKTSPLDQATTDSLTQQFRAIQLSTGLMAETLGLASGAVASFTKDIKLSFKGLTEEQIQEKMAAEFTAISDEMAGQVLGTLQTEYAKANETASQTLNRLATSLITVNSAFELLGVAMLDASVASGDMASRLIEQSGGGEAFAANLGTYYDNFYDQAEKTAYVTGQVTAALASVGLQMPKTREEFRALVESQIALGEGGTKAVAALLGVSGAFSQLATVGDTIAATRASLQDRLDALQGNDRAILDRQRKAEYDALMKLDPALAALVSQIYEMEDAARAAADAEAARVAAIDKAYTNLEAAYRREEKVLQARLDGLAQYRKTIEQQYSLRQESLSLITGVFDVLRSSVQDLYASVESAAAMQAEQGREFIAQAMTAALTTGYLPEQDQLSEAIRAARAGVDSGQFANTAEQDFAKLVLAGQLRALEQVAGKQKTDAEMQLEALQSQLDAIDEQTDAINRQIKLQQDALDYFREQIDIANGVYDATLSIEDALRAMADALGLEMANTKPLPANGEGSGGGGAVFGGGSGSTPAPAPARYSRLIYGGTAGVGREGIRDQSLIDRLDKLSPVYHSFDGTGDLPGLAAAMKAAGGTIADLSILSGNWESDWRKAFESVGIPAFAVGTNYVPRDMLAQIHEGEAIVPKAFNPWAGGSMGNDNTALIAEIRSLREEVAGLRAAAEETAGATGATADVLVRVTQNGNGMVTAAAPI